ncbi:MAG: Spy/CpxP family protein refolding chaperone [Gallionella sp.]
MKLPNVNPKLGIMATLITGAILISSFYTIAMADPSDHCDYRAMSPQQIQQHIQERMKTRMDRLEQRLEIKASQQDVWDDFAKSIESLPDLNAKKPGDDADAATVARYRANRASEMAGKLTKIADATAKLQASLTPDQRKVLDQTAHFFLHHQRAGYGFHGMRMHHDEDGHNWKQQEHGSS